MSLADRIKAGRAALKLKQDEVVTVSGIPLSTYRKYEGGTAEPGAKAMAGLVATGLNANWLLTGEGPMLLAELARQADELEQARRREADLQAELDALAARYQQSRGVPLNEPAMRAIITGVIEGTRGRDLAPEQIAEKSVELYCRALSEDLITPTGIGKGGSQAA